MSVLCHECQKPLKASPFRRRAWNGFPVCKECYAAHIHKALAPLNQALRALQLKDEGRGE